MNVSLDTKQRLNLETHFDYAVVCQRIPDKRAWDAKIKKWIVTPSRVNIEYLRKELPKLIWSDAAKALADKVVAAGTPPEKADVSDYVFAEPPPYNHQREAFSRTRNADAYALLMEQRCGKTRADIDDSTDAFQRGLIDLVLIVCPNSVKSVWIDEVKSWTPKHVRTEAILYKASDRKDCAAKIKAWQPGRLQYLIVNCEAFSSQISEDWVMEQLKGRKVKMSIDEASRFKSPSSSRSKALLRFRKIAKRRRILTGTLITQGPLDAYIPFAFLDPAILGYSSFYSFRGDFALLGGYMGKSVVGYVNTDRLAGLIAPFSYRVTRDQCFDMPPKVYTKINVQLSEEQRKLYNDMRDQMLAEFDDPDGGIEVPIYDDDYNQVGTKKVHQVTATIILTKMLRLQQITGGFFPDMNGRIIPIPGKNPKLDALLEELDECQSKSIIWARFRPEIALVSLALRQRYGDDAVVEFHGGIKENDRTINRKRFQDPNDTVKFFVGQPDAGGIGIPLHAAHNVFYFSNSFRLEARLQSEDRAQNLENKHKVGYTDLIAEDTLDPGVIASLRGKKSLADQVNRDNIKEWI